MKIAFTTLGCPGWSWEEILAAAGVLGYDGICLRSFGGGRQAPLPRDLSAVGADLARRGLEVYCVDTSVRFDGGESWEDMLSEGMRQIELAAALGAGSVRVFGDSVPPGRAREDVMDDIARGLGELARLGGAAGVEVLLETHGDFARGADVRRLVEKAAHPCVGVIWDIHHPFRAGEPPVETYRLIRPCLRGVHLKDSRVGDGVVRPCLLGSGDVPVRECLGLLRGGGYDGWLALEWEKRWHPEIEPPEVAFPQFIKVIKGYLAEL